MKLRRRLENGVFGGVCSGIGEWLGIKASVIRLLFVVGLLCYTFTFWIYVLLWVFLQKD